MTILGEILSKEPILMADVSLKTDLRISRLSQMNNNKTITLKVEELYLIALVIDVPLLEILTKVWYHLN